MTDSTDFKAPAIVPANAMRALTWRDFSSDKTESPFRITDATGNSRVIRLSKNKKRVLKALVISPIYCASPVRISDIVHLLKGEYGINIHMELYSNDHETDRTKFGVYFLVSHIEELAPSEVAA